MAAFECALQFSTISFTSVIRNENTPFIHSVLHSLAFGAIQTEPLISLCCAFERNALENTQNAFKSHLFALKPRREREKKNNKRSCKFKIHVDICLHNNKKRKIKICTDCQLTLALNLIAQIIISSVCLFHQSIASGYQVAGSTNQSARMNTQMKNKGNHSLPFFFLSLLFLFRFLLVSCVKPNVINIR